MGLGKTFLQVRLHGWMSPALAVSRHGAVNDLTDEGSSVQTLGVALHPSVAAQHVAKKHGEHTNVAAAVVANAQAAKQELPFQELSARFEMYLLTIFEHD